MSGQPVLYGFDGSTYVRTVRMLLHDKGAAYEQVPVNVLAGEARRPEHLARHPFGKVPVLDIDGLRIRETDAICRYLDETLPGPSLVPDTPADRARMTEAINLTNSYGYAALLGVVGHHLFPEFIGGADDDRHAGCLAASETFLTLLIENRRDSRWLAGDGPSLADYFLAPIMFYVALTPDAERLFAVPGVQDWWDAMVEVESFQRTEPDLG